MAVRTDIQVVWNPTPAFVANAFFASADQLSNLGPAMEDIVGIVAEEYAQNFGAEGRPDPWAPLADATVRKRGSDHPILQDEGTMYGEATDPGSWKISVQGQGAIASLEIVSYSRFHLTGTQHMPARIWDYISPEVEEQMDEILIDFMEQPLEEAGWH